MRKIRNIKLNSAGPLAAALMLTLAACPLLSRGALAYSDAPSGSGPTAYGDNGSGGGGTKPINSTVGISFSPSAGEASMTPTTTAGASARTMVLAKVDVQNSGGYSVYLGSKNQNLVGRNKGELIAPVTGNVPYNNLSANTWGYAAAEGTTVSDSATYKAVSTSGNGAYIGGNTSSNISNESKTFALSFAAKIGSDKPADVYQNEVIVSVVSAPGQVALFGGIQTLQAMTPSICSAAEVGDEVQLRDTRDGKMYWVSKLADNNCWMTQNLDLDLSTSKYLSPSDSDVSSNWTPGYATATTVDSSTILADNLGQRSWNLGNYRITNPTTANDCGSKKNNLADCSAQFTDYGTPTTTNGDKNAHYIAGNHYQWNAATAGTGGTIASGQASGSICPKGWRLPTSTSSGDFQNLLNAGNINNSVSKFTSAPYYFVRGGFVVQVTEQLFNAAGNYGYYWSSTPYSDSRYAYYLNFYDDNTINPSYDDGRYLGFSVRCIARTGDEPVAQQVTYSITYAHDDRSQGTLPAKQEVESSADSYTFIAPEKPSDLHDGSCSHPFVGWSTTKQGYTYTADYTAGSSITLTKDNPHITLYPVWRPANYC